MKSARQKERELMIKLSLEKRTDREIAGILGVSKSRVSYWLIRNRTTGSLEDKPRSGRPTILKEKLSDVSNNLKETVRNPKRKNAGLSSKEVLEYLRQETGKTYSMRHVQRLMHKMGFSKTTPRVSHIRKDEKAQEKFRRDFKKKFGKSMWVITS